MCAVSRARCSFPGDTYFLNDRGHLLWRRNWMWCCCIETKPVRDRNHSKPNHVVTAAQYVITVFKFKVWAHWPARICFYHLSVCPCLYISKQAWYLVLSFSVNTSFNTTITISASLCIFSLSVQISLLKQSLELQLSQSQSALQQLQSQFNQERELLSQQLKG